jgi:hypothetical protein
VDFLSRVIQQYRGPEEFFSEVLLKHPSVPPGPSTRVEFWSVDLEDRDTGDKVELVCLRTERGGRAFAPFDRSRVPFEEACHGLFRAYRTTKKIYVANLN